MAFDPMTLINPLAGALGSGLMGALFGGGGGAQAISHPKGGAGQNYQQWQQQQPQGYAMRDLSPLFPREEETNPLNLLTWRGW